MNREKIIKTNFTLLSLCKKMEVQEKEEQMEKEGRKAMAD